MDAIHFLNTGHSDCIILESCGRFAMVDAGEDSDYPADMPWLKYKGYEDVVCNYLLKNCANAGGKVTLDFVVGTHAHSDHIGGFDTVINNKAITVKKAYLKPYSDDNTNLYERKRWDNDIVYEQMKAALQAKNVSVTESFEGEETTLGNFKIKFYNGSNQNHVSKSGENTSSVVMLLEAHGKRAVLAGDLNFRFGAEKKISAQIGRVDLLKVAHHGYARSSTAVWLKNLSPQIDVICNEKRSVHASVMHRLKKYTGARIYTTVDYNGIKAVFTPDDIKIEKNIMNV